MRLAILCSLLVACGGVSTGTTRATVTGDQRIEVTLVRDGGAAAEASAPAPAPAPPADAGPSGCWCPTVQVTCTGGGDTYARADRGACTLHLPPLMCDVLGLVEGATVDSVAAAGATPGRALTADGAFDFCGGRHEASHACDGPDVSDCTSEVRAYGVTVSCLAEVVPQLCGADDPESGECKRIRLYVEAAKAARELNECLCAGTACGACTDACLAGHPELPGTCAQAAVAYCP